MKQGSGKTTVAGGKVEPRSRGINPAAASAIGVQQVRTKPLQVHEGRGVMAPKAMSTSHKCGSQGKH